MTPLQDDCKEELRDAAKNWIAMDGLWFQAVEQEYGMEAAVVTGPERLETVCSH